MFELKRKIMPALTKYDFYFDRPRESADAFSKVVKYVFVLLPRTSDPKDDFYKTLALHYYSEYVNLKMYSPSYARSAISGFLSHMYRYYEPSRVVIEAHFCEIDAHLSSSSSNPS